ncbi:hypothetical protein L198_04868 [Cryptococcus wingfieldii CBS 7118]|uniref:THO complex subunit 5 n=1 Tax=Cryptococcus wingfieldii CBS 7118 TaxID=1295528 RepID=A0A1E3J239_9TREE|nr:hypothetical protein L198_04868 [Cryptococcus wingfieldii CBS 7118]ODN94725.1 hypothetical protein L198_04868 [Cryptococcus wingfieldii CBS 7118]
MALPQEILPQHPSDPLLLLPVPNPLPPTPTPSLPSLLAALAPHLTPTEVEELEKVPIPVLTSTIRQFTRHSQTLLNAARAGVTEAREELDEVDVRLREVEYERERVREETERCEEYAQTHGDVELPDVETFLSSVDQTPKESESYEQTLGILRLEHELGEILKREAQVAQITKERDAYIKAKKEIKVKSDAVDVHLAQFARVRPISYSLHQVNTDEE